VSLQSATGTISILSTDTIGTTKVVSGLAFAPQIVFFFWSGQASSTDAITGANMQFGAGLATGAADRRAAGGQSDHGVSTTNTQAGYRNDVVAFMHGGAGGWLGLLDLQSMDGGGFTTVIDDQFPSDMRVNWFAIGGGDITNLSVGTFQATTVSTTQSITAPGFQSDLVFFLRAGRSAGAPPNDTADGNVVLGANDGTRQWVCSWCSDDLVTTTSCGRHGNGSQSIVAAATTSIQRRATTAITSTGFDVTWDATPATAYQTFYVCIKGGKWRADSLLTRTDGADISKTGFGFQPVGALFVSHGTAENTVSGVTTHSAMTIGAASSVSSRGAMAGTDQHAVTTTACTEAIEYDEVYIRIDPTTSAVVGLMDLKSFDADGLTCVMDDTDPDAAWCGFLAAGELAAGGGDLSWLPGFSASGGTARTIVVG
jgi:hypothetical protein